jgi:hypothetical protein
MCMTNRNTDRYLNTGEDMDRSKARLEEIWTAMGLKRNADGVALCLICEKQPAKVVLGSISFCSEECKTEDMRRNFPDPDDEWDADCCPTCGR